MSDDTKKQTPLLDQKPVSTHLLELVSGQVQRVKAENLSLKAERNARRWKAERNPVEYAAQKTAQREAYRNRVASEKGREVRAYNPVNGKTREEYDANARKRNAERNTALRADAGQDDKDKDADRKWKVRQVKSGKTAAQIEEGMAKRLAERKIKPTPYSHNPKFGAF